MKVNFLLRVLLFQMHKFFLCKQYKQIADNNGSKYSGVQNATHATENAFMCLY